MAFLAGDGFVSVFGGSFMIAFLGGGGAFDFTVGGDLVDSCLEIGFLTSLVGSTFDIAVLGVANVGVAFVGAFAGGFTGSSIFVFDATLFGGDFEEIFVSFVSVVLA